MTDRGTGPFAMRDAYPLHVPKTGIRFPNGRNDTILYGMNTLETAPGNQIETKTEPRRISYDLSLAGQVIDDFRKRPKELEEVLRHPELFLSLIRDRERRDEETDRRFDRMIFDALRNAPIIGEGTSSCFRRPEDPAVRDALRNRFDTDIGLRELKRSRIIDPRTGRTYAGIETNRDKPDPVGDARHGAVTQAVIANLSPGLMPQVFDYVEERGARDTETGEPIPGLEDEVVGVMSVMEVLNGVSIGQIIDRDGVFWQRRYSARKPNEFLDFLRSEEYREYIRYSIEEAVHRYPALLAAEWDGLPDRLDDTMGRFDNLSEDIAAIFGDGHMGNVGIVFADQDGRTLRQNPIGIMDPDLARLSTRPGFGTLAKDYVNERKSTSLGIDYLMPDRTPEGMSRKEREVLGMDSVAILSIIFALIGETVRDIIRKKSEDRVRPRS